MTKTQSHVPQSVGERIAHARRLLGLAEGVDVSAPELAERVGVTSESVYNWEGDKSIPKGRNMAQLATVLGVTPAYLHYGVEARAETKGETDEDLAQLADPFVDEPSSPEKRARDDRIDAGKKLAQQGAKTAAKRKTV